MPRQSRGRPAARPAAPASSQQTRGAHTAAAPPVQRQAPPAAAAQPQSPGLFANMASTAAGVAVGSSVGHGISSMLFGGSSSAAAPPAEAPVAQQNTWQSQNASCEVQARDFTKCLEAADMQSCSWYLDQLKACQSAAKPY